MIFRIQGKGYVGYSTLHIATVDGTRLYRLLIASS